MVFGYVRYKAGFFFFSDDLRSKIDFEIPLFHVITLQKFCRPVIYLLFFLVRSSAMKTKI